MNENTRDQNSWDTAKTAPREKFEMPNAYIRRGKLANQLKVHLKTRQNKHKASKTKKIIKIR